jgi:hypothetical protein
MPSNQEKDRMECFKEIDDILTKTLKKIGEIHYKTFLKELLTKHAVSRKKIDEFLKEFYIEEELIIIKEGVIYPRK